MRDERLNETKFFSLYMELTECSEAAARSVYIFVSQEPAPGVEPGLTEEREATAIKASHSGADVSRN